MCGITGFNWKDGLMLQKMGEAIKHRGPDGNGTYLGSNISLGHLELAVLNLSENGHQPMFSEDKNLILIFNGRIYNFP